MLAFINFLLVVFALFIAGFAGMIVFNLLSEKTRNEIKNFFWSIPEKLF